MKKMILTVFATSLLFSCSICFLPASFIGEDSIKLLFSTISFFSFRLFIMADECIPILEWPPPDHHEVEDEEQTAIPIPKVNDYDIEETPSKKIKFEFDYPLADISLARWLKRNLELKKKYKLENIKNPRTLINTISGTEEGKAFLRKEIQSLMSSEDHFKNDPNYYYVLTTYYDKLHYLESSMANISKCLKLFHEEMTDIFGLELRQYLAELAQLTDFQKNVLWLHQKLLLEQEMTSQGAGLQETEREGEVEVSSYSAMTEEKFSSLCHSRTPVLLTEVPRPTDQPWTLEHIRTMAGDMKVEVKRKVEGSTEWAGLEVAEVKTVSQFLEDGREEEYLFDWSLPLHCPQLSEEFRVPPLLEDNILTSTTSHAQYRNSWPSLFIAKAGTHSGLHIDAFGSHFWMYLFSGEKRWTFYPPETAGRLGPTFYSSLDPVFRPGPDLPSLPSYSLTLLPGQLLFVPAGAPHRVENISDTIAVSANLVNQSNIGLATKYFKINALLDPRTEDLLHELSNLIK